MVHSGNIMSIRNKVLAICAVVAMGMSFASLQAKAAVSTFDIGTISFGGPAITGLVGSGSMSGTFDFDDVTNLVTGVNFTVTGTTSLNPGGNVDGSYDSVFNFLDTSVPLSGVFAGTLTAVRGIEGAVPTAALVLNLTRTSGQQDFNFSASVGRCESFGGIGGSIPCSLIVAENTSSTAIAQAGPGDFGVVPLPAPILMLMGALGVFGAMAMRRRPAFA